MMDHNTDFSDLRASEIGPRHTNETHGQSIWRDIDFFLDFVLFTLAYISIVTLLV